MSEDLTEYLAPTVQFEVWRLGPGKKPVVLYTDLSESEARACLHACLHDKATAYPEANVKFFLVETTVQRKMVMEPRG